MPNGIFMTIKYILEGRLIYIQLSPEISVYIFQMMATKVRESKERERTCLLYTTIYYYIYYYILLL